MRRNSFLFVKPDILVLCEKHNLKIIIPGLNQGSQIRMRSANMICAAPNDFQNEKYPKITCFLSDLHKMGPADTKYGFCAALFLHNVALGEIWVRPPGLSDSHDCGFKSRQKTST